MASGFKQKRIKLMDKMLCMLSSGKSVHSKSLCSNSGGINKSNITRLFKDCVRLGIIKETDKCKDEDGSIRKCYDLTDNLSEKIKEPNNTVFELRKCVRDLLRDYYNKSKKNPPENGVRLKRSEILYLMALDGYFRAVEIVRGSQSAISNNDLINEVRNFLERQYGSQYVTRTIQTIEEVLGSNTEHKIETVQKDISTNTNITVFRFMTEDDLKHTAEDFIHNLIIGLLHNKNQNNS